MEKGEEPLPEGETLKSRRTVYSKYKSAAGTPLLVSRILMKEMILGSDKTQTLH